MTIYITKKLNFTIKADRDKVMICLTYVALSLAALAIILVAVAAVLYFSTPRLTVEAGESISPSDFVRWENAEFGEDFDPDCIHRSGVYYFTVIAGDKETEVRLRVKDTKPPEIEVKDVLCGMGTALPVPEDFIASADEASDFKGVYVEGLPEIKRPGTYSAKVRFTDEWGNKTEIYSVKVTVLSDTELPKVEILGDVTMYIGDEKPDYSQLVAASDNCIGEITLKFDDGDVNYEKKGSYKVKVTATDASGNKGSASIKVSVLEKED